MRWTPKGGARVRWSWWRGEIFRGSVPGQRGLRSSDSRGTPDSTLRSSSRERLNQDLRGKDRRGILASGHVHLDYPYDVRILRGRRRGCKRFRRNMH